MKKVVRSINATWAISQDKVVNLVNATPTALGEYLIVLPKFHPGKNVEYMVVSLDKNLRWKSATLCPTKEIAIIQKTLTRKWHKLLATHRKKKLRGKAADKDFDRICRIHDRQKKKVGVA